MPDTTYDADDYYGYRPLMQLERPVALFGIPGTRIGRTGRAINLVSGLAFVWMDRRVEHKLGRSVQRAEIEEARVERIAAEREALAEALSRRAPPVIVLSDVTLTDPAMADRIAKTCQLVRVEIDVDEALVRIERDVQEDARRHWTFRARCGLDHDTMREELLRLQAELPPGDMVLPVHKRTPMEVAQDFLKQRGLDTT